MKAETFIQLMTFFLLSLITSSTLGLPFSNSAKAEVNGNSIDVNSEYSSGTISSPIQTLSLWYAWINCNGTQVIYLAYQSTSVRPPVITFVGQRYITENDEEVFVGNTLTGMEVYNDTNGNGIPDGPSEILYNFAVNSSASFEATPIKKSIVQGTAHYTWGVRYNDIDGFFLTNDQVEGANVILEYLNFSFDFSILGNRSILKTDFGIGRITDVTYSNFNLNLTGLSLSLLYGTAVLTPKNHVTLVDGSPYNSMTAQASTGPAESGQITIGNVTAYEFLFGQNYTLFTASQNQSIPSLAVGAAQESVSEGLYRPVEPLISDFEDVLNGVFSKMGTINEPINLDYINSSFLYRVCYPDWSGNPIEHDPEYVAHLTTSANSVLPTTSFPWIFLISAVIISSAVLLGAIYDLKRTRKIGFLKTLNVRRKT
ncbi:MAG TPA: hypothetical protein VMT42_02145 [candidate division Zixibacteria bacterium]|nr:hypothetical protein [candidate division Zixibacteria bacterium]